MPDSPATFDGARIGRRLSPGDPLSLATATAYSSGSTSLQNTNAIISDDEPLSSACDVPRY
jgi:hypothetical protein